MGMCNAGDIFQAKLDELLGDIKSVKTYINSILVLRKDRFSNHTEQQRIIFGRFRAVGLKVNSTMCSFVLKEIPYLGYVITWEGIKPDPKIVQEIMDIGRPTTMNEA